jgi:L-alanine-DL-glutamate epimerase-like enolase superfamily enzyme
MTVIRRVRARNVGFSRIPQTLRHSLVTNASIFEDFKSRGEGWFGPTFCTLVEIETSDGVVGVGTAGGFSGATKSIVEDYLADLVIGEDIRDHERLWQRMYRTTVRFGRRGPAVSALSAIDIAVWDAHGISEGKSVVELLGGRTRVNAPIYVSRLYALEDLDELAAEAMGYVAQGVTRMKQRFGFGPQDGPLGMQRNVALVRTVREAIGESIELAADAYMGWDIGYTIEITKRLREFGLSWIEEPLMPEQVDRYAELRLRLPWQRWSCGEHSYTKWDFADLIRLRATDILQPDLNRTGGLTEGRKIAALAETAGLPLVPHSNEAHNLALVFSQSPNVCPVVEYFPNVEPDTGNELFWKLFTGNPVAKDGTLEFPTDRPGLGISPREDVVGSLLTADGGWHVD